MEVGDIFKTLEESFGFDGQVKDITASKNCYSSKIVSCHHLNRLCGLVLLDRMWSQATTQTSSIWTARPQLLSSLRHPLGGLRCWAEACDGACNVDNFNVLAIVKSEVK